MVNKKIVTPHDCTLMHTSVHPRRTMSISSIDVAAVTSSQAVEAR
jgi:hypothetical protein